MAFEMYKYKTHPKIECDDGSHNNMPHIHANPSTSHSHGSYGLNTNNHAQFQCVTCEKLFFLNQLHGSNQNGVIKYYCHECVDKLTEDLLKPEKLAQNFPLNNTSYRLCSNNQPLHCEGCVKKCNYPPSENKLVETKRERMFECDICLKEFTQLAHLKTHKLIHTGEKSYQCEICLKRFTRKSGLDVHKLIHTGEKSYKCDICFMRFVQPSHLKTHKLTHTREKSFECDVCFKKFARKSGLDVHKLIHSGEKSYECDVCLKRFIQPSHLSTHKLIHTGERPFECNICLKRFNRAALLRKHQDSHRKQSLM